jgi:serine/threonine protein kinase
LQDGCARIPPLCKDTTTTTTTAADQTWIVLELCDRGSLMDAVERGWFREQRSCVSGPVSLLAVLATAAEVAAGMACLHSAAIVHGDLSAWNVMLSRCVLFCSNIL